MSETQNPTTTEILDSYLPLVASGIGEAQLEIVRRLELLLPGVIDLDNSRNGQSGELGVPKPRRYSLARSVLSETDLNCVLVGAKVTTSAQGIGAFKNMVEIAVYSVDERLSSPTQLASQWRRAELIRACLMPFLNGCIDADGKPVWRQLVPTGYAPLPGDWSKQFSGIACRFSLVQTPG